MSEKECPVNTALTQLTGILHSNRLSHPKSRVIAEEIRQLLYDVSWGRSGEKHLAALESLAQQLMDESLDEGGILVGRGVGSVIREHREVFLSHINTHNCPTGDCIKLAPSPCQMTCPAGIDVPTYVSLIGMGQDAEAVNIIRKDNPFPWICGLICTRPCEFMCVRGRIDTPISIRYLKAFAAERALSERRYENPQKEPDKNQKVCVIGAGPAGLTAAYYLALKGYGVRVLEAMPMAGGMMMVGIPRYRLPREVIDREVAMIEALGVEFAFNTRFGKDVTLEQLKKEGFAAFLIAIGAHQSFKLNIPGERDFSAVIDAIVLLRRVALGERHMPGKKVAVIGGGNVAIDAARTCIRLGCEEVTIVYRRTRSEMPADEEEVEQAEEEGIRLSFLTIPVEVKGAEGKITSLRCLRAELGPPDESGRRRPIPVEGSDHHMAVDAVIPAIGQEVDSKWLDSLADLRWTRRTTIHINRVTMETSMAGVFSAGDAVLGPATVVEAIGGGKRAADAIDRYLSGIPQPTMPPVPVRRDRASCLEVPASMKMSLKRPEMQLLNLDRRRTTFQQVELGCSENQVREEARRCLRCDICRRCGDCVAVCRDQMKIDALQMGYLDFDHPVATDFRRTDERCITCGACAENCPNGAMRIEDREGERVLSLCGTILNRQKLEYCRSCGAALGPAKYLDFVGQKVGGIAEVTSGRLICGNCARKGAGKKVVPPSIF